ncbi:SMI1/KNR4 family protein [Sorangium sp. So ce388]|uniref:SMI1/KNR4 family protein n=1 Tax=Sorangium sp. So ce388 TaxID=3133309 RepID=UPI003F5C8558
MCERLDGIAAKLTAVRARGLSCFGSDVHSFALRPPATEAEVAAFEATRRVRLPEDYRAFLLHAGHGGAGPYYGLMTLAQWDHARYEAKGDLDAACPMHPDTLPPGEEVARGAPARRGRGDGPSCWPITTPAATRRRPARTKR